MVLAAVSLAPWMAGGAGRPDPPRPRPEMPPRRRQPTKPAARRAAPADSHAPKPGEWEPFVDPEDQIFPSLLLASATHQRPPARQEPPPTRPRTRRSRRARKKHRRPRKARADAARRTPEIFGDENGLLGVTLVSPGGRRARAGRDQGKRADGRPASLEADLPTKGKEYHLLPKVDYKYDALNRVRQSHPVNVTFSVQVDGKSLGQQFVTARVHPINDCPYAYQNPDDEKDYVDIAWMFAAYVNEDHPAIPTCSRRRRRRGSWTGSTPTRATIRARCCSRCSPSGRRCGSTTSSTATSARPRPRAIRSTRCTCVSLRKRFPNPTPTASMPA